MAAVVFRTVHLHTQSWVAKVKGLTQHSTFLACALCASPYDIFFAFRAYGARHAPLCSAYCAPRATCTLRAKSGRMGRPMRV